jgi:hypothetical protein
MKDSNLNQADPGNRAFIASAPAEIVDLYLGFLFPEDQLRKLQKSLCVPFDK